VPAFTVSDLAIFVRFARCFGNVGLFLIFLPFNDRVLGAAAERVAASGVIGRENFLDWLGLGVAKDNFT
jgi:hypothetical protein